MKMLNHNDRDEKERRGKKRKKEGRYEKKNIANEDKERRNLSSSIQWCMIRILLLLRIILRRTVIKIMIIKSGDGIEKPGTEWLKEWGKKTEKNYFLPFIDKIFLRKKCDITYVRSSEIETDLTLDWFSVPPPLTRSRPLQVTATPLPTPQPQ